MDEPLEEQMGSMIVCGKFCSGVMSTSPLPSCDKHQSFLFDETSRQGIYDNWVPFGGSVFRQISRQLGHEADKAFPCIYVAQSLPCGPAGKESAGIAGDLGSIPGLWRSPGKGKGYQPPVFWPGEFHGLYSSGVTESDMTEWLSLFKGLQFKIIIISKWHLRRWHVLNSSSQIRGSICSHPPHTKRRLWGVDTRGMFQALPSKCGSANN